VAVLYRSPAHEASIRDWCTERLAGWDRPHTTREVATSLGRTHLTEAGTGDDLCLYLPGTNFNAATSTRVLTELAGTCRVVCADLPGQPGLSAAARPDDETPAYARWLAEVLAAAVQGAPPRRVVLAGHSRGAAVALTADPASVDGLVLLSPAGLAKVRITPSLLAHTLGWLMWPTPARSRRVVDLMAGPGDGALDDVVAWMTLVARGTRTTGAPGPLPEELPARWRDRPVRVLVGEHDAFFPLRRLAPAARRLLGTEVEVVPRTGHLLVDQRPAVAAAAVTSLATPG
jgi:pimeloyl-ACP methyl ester carboxylesterase